MTSPRSQGRSEMETRLAPSKPGACLRVKEICRRQTGGQSFPMSRLIPGLSQKEALGSRADGRARLQAGKTPLKSPQPRIPHTISSWTLGNPCSDSNKLPQMC